MHTGLRDIDPVGAATVRDLRHASGREHSMHGSEPVVMAVSDSRTCAELSAVLAAQQIEVRAFGSAGSCIEAACTQPPLCLIADFDLPDLSGLELQRQIISTVNVPIIFVSGPCDTRSVVHAMKSGALDFLTRPIDPAALLAAVHAAFARQRIVETRQAEWEILETRYSQVTPREREVFALIARGLQNKQAASILGIAKVTLQIHRSNVMRKMQAGSFAELVRMAVRLRTGSPARDRYRSLRQPAAVRGEDRILSGRGILSGHPFHLRAGHRISSIDDIQS